MIYKEKRNVGSVIILTGNIRLDSSLIILDEGQSIIQMYQYEGYIVNISALAPCE